MISTGRHALSAPPRFARPRSAARGRTERWRDRLRPPTRLGVTAMVAVVVALTGMIAAVLTHTAAPRTVAGAAAGPARDQAAGAGSARDRAAQPAPHGSGAAAPAGTASANPARGLAARPEAAQPNPAAIPLVLTAADHKNCPATATACVDLARHVTWLQADGKVTYGPLPMEPGKPGGGHETPRGTFEVQWKAGPTYVSNIYHDPMPWATFFATGGIAFHGGSLTDWSHGCVHLTDANAHYYNAHLPLGAQVVVF